MCVIPHQCSQTLSDGPEACITASRVRIAVDQFKLPYARLLMQGRRKLIKPGRFTPEEVVQLRLIPWEDLLIQIRMDASKACLQTTLESGRQVVSPLKPKAEAQNHTRNYNKVQITRL